MSVEHRQTVVLCEGFDDRSFWRGWLLHLGCTDPTERGRRTVPDVRGKPVEGRGKFLFRTSSGSDVIVQPFHGRRNARRAVEEYLGNLQAVQPARVVLNLDSDAEDDSSESAEDQVEGIARSLGGTGDRPGPYAIGGSLLYPVIWTCDDAEPTAGVPRKQTLERLVTSAMRAAHPDRGEAVQAWLDGEPPGLRLPRSYGYSYFAKWYSDHGEGHFYECLWDEKGIARELKKRLESAGAWRVVEELVSG